ncbi:unnamed protein product [Hyaloperonospora brassicae]|uniref:RxLR effector candidate protein n=1 Tax=Hyaloperonospora brassicae TaxID=162125 RepID=A0AAV0TL14_HYABA|nr:unnamed protein product [Hyaloperonospora brassicae]
MMPPTGMNTTSGSADMMPPPEWSTTSDLFDTASQSESSSMSDSTDTASQSESMSTSGSADMMPPPEWSTMSGSIDADLALAPTPSPPALPPFTATSSSQSGSDLADGPPVASTTNATSPQLLTTPSPSEQRPASGSSDDISATATSTVVVSGSASGSDASNETGSFPEVSVANMSTPVPTTMPAALSSSGNGSYPETGSRGVGPTGSVVGPRATAASPTMNSSSDPSPWLGNVGFGSGASSGSADVGDFWSSASKSRGDGSLDSVDSDNGVESYAGEVAVPSPLLRPSSESGPPPPSLPAPPLLFPSSGSLKSERVTRPPIKSPSSSGVLVLPPITDDSADSVDPLATGGSQTRVNDGESGGNSALGTSTILFIIVGCIVAAALVFGAVWLRPKRADPLEVCDPDESREPTDAYPYAGSESAGPYDASRTPRVITGYDRMDVRGSNEYFGA